MPTLHTTLQEGFSGDEVVLTVDGREVFHKARVQTRAPMGIAATHELHVSSGPVSVEVALPGRKLTQIVPLDVRGDLFLAVSLDSSGTLHHVVHREPFAVE